MKLALSLAALALFQLAPTDTGPAADPQHLRFQRAVQLPPDANGPACAVLDAAVYAHARDRSASDLRLYSGSTEVPFVLTENSPAPVDSEHLTPQNLGIQDGRVVFDLAMPARPYSEVDLELNLRDFLAVAEVSAPQPNAAPIDLGTFTLFDLTSQHGARSTALALQESTFPRLHIVLRMLNLRGEAYPVAPAVLRGATVPPSREAQTLFVPAASTNAIGKDGHFTVARFDMPAHVPIERATVVLDPAFHGNFVRSITVADMTHFQEHQPPVVTDAANESVSGEISREVLTIAGAPPIHSEKLSIDTELGSNLRDPATIQVAVDNGDDRPLPIRSVRLEMRQRRICFNAQPRASYTLRYGDPALHAPVYDFARLFNPAAAVIEASLAPEQLNPSFTARADTRPYTERHPELLWIALIAVVVLLGATAIGSVKHQRRSQRP